MAIREQGSPPHLVMLETWLQESGFRLKDSVLNLSQNLFVLNYHTSFSTLTTPW